MFTSFPRSRRERSAVFCFLIGPLVLAACGREAASSPDAGPGPALVQVSFPGHSPALRWDGSGALHVVAVEGHGAAARLLYRRLEPGAPAAAPVAVSPPGLAVAAHGDAVPVLEVLPDGSLFTAYPVALPGKWKSEIRAQVSADRGATWSPPALVHGDGGQPGSHSYLSSTLAPDGTVALAWLDDRSGRMGLATATSRDGRSFAASRALDPATCECCGTALLASRGGALWLAYRDEEADVRDMKLLAAPAGRDFGPAVPVSADGWRIPGCPHSGPRLAEDGDGALWAAWFTGAGPGVYVAASRDGGATFSPRTVIARPEGRVATVGHPEIGALPDGRLAVLYEAAGPDGDQVFARLRLPGSPAWGPPLAVAPGGSAPRFAAGPSGRAAVAFTAGDSITVAEWPLLENGKLDLITANGSAAHSH